MNQEIYEKNMAAFHKRFDFLAKQMEDQEYELLEGFKVEIEDGDLLRAEREGQSVLIGTHYAEKERAEKWIENFLKLPEYSTVFLVGIGNAFYLRELLGKTSEKLNILVYEPCVEIVLKLLEEIDITEIFDNRPVALLMKGVNEEDLIPVLNAWLTNETFPYFRTKIMPGYDKLFFEEIKECLDIVKRILIQIKVSQNTISLFGNFYAKNVIGNAKEVLKSYTINQLLGTIPHDRPAIIIAAGPSLKKNIHELKRAEGRAFLIAVDTALKPLVQEGILPDLFITIDGNKPVALFDLDEIWKIPMVLSADVNNDVVKHHTGKKIFYYHGEGFIQGFYLNNKVPCSAISSGGSVANSAFSLAEFLGFQTIILVGQDLAYTGNRSHVEGSFTEEEMGKFYKSATAKVEDIEGNMVPTQPNMIMYLQWFEERIKARPELKVIDATEGGAKKKGAVLMTLKEAIDTECPEEKVDYKKMIDELPYAFTEEMNQKNREYLFSAMDVMRDGMKKAGDGLRFYKQLETQFKRERIDKKKVKKLNKRIKKLSQFFEYNPVMSVVMQSVSTISFAISRGMYDYEEDIHDEGVMIARQGIVMMTCIKISLRNVMPILEKMLEELRAEEEEKENHGSE